MLRREGLTFRLVQSIGTVGDIARVEERRRLAGTQIEDVVHGHVGCIRFLRSLVGDRVFEQVRNRLACIIRDTGGGVVILVIVFECGFERKTHVAELQGHRVDGQLDVLACGQAHQLAVVRHHERAVGGMQISYGAIALLVDGEDRMSFRHGLARIHDVETSEPVIRQRAQRFAPDFHAFAVMKRFHVVSVNFDGPLPRHSSILAHRCRPSFRTTLSAIVS